MTTGSVCELLHIFAWLLVLDYGRSNHHYRDMQALHSRNSVPQRYLACFVVPILKDEDNFPFVRRFLFGKPSGSFDNGFVKFRRVATLMNQLGNQFVWIG